MEGLVVVHADMAREFKTGRHKNLLSTLVVEIEKFVQKGKNVYYLGYSNYALDPRIAQYRTKIVYVSGELPRLFETQFLQVKEQILDDAIKRVKVGGLSSRVCVADMHALLQGKEGPYAKMETYRKASEELGWLIKKFESVFRQKVEASIDTKLTN